jgi:hypothetical protein
VHPSSAPLQLSVAFQRTPNQAFATEKHALIDTLVGGMLRSIDSGILRFSHKSDEWLRMRIQYTSYNQSHTHYCGAIDLKKLGMRHA